MVAPPLPVGNVRREKGKHNGGGRGKKVDFHKKDILERNSEKENALREGDKIMLQEQSSLQMKIVSVFVLKRVLYLLWFCGRICDRKYV